MKKLLLPVAAIAAIFLWQHFNAVDNHPTDLIESRETAANSDSIAAAFEDRAGDRQISGRGVVLQILPDDNDGSRHQRFILRLESGQTLLISHNIDLTPRVAGLASPRRANLPVIDVISVPRHTAKPAACTGGSREIHS